MKNKIEKIITYYPSKEEEIYKIEMSLEYLQAAEECREECITLKLEVYEKRMDGDYENEVYITGNINSSHCFNFHVHYCMHFCGVENMEKQLGLFTFLYKEAEKYVYFD